jgi:hypothetical protein
MWCEWLPLAHRHATHWSFHVKTSAGEISDKHPESFFLNDYTIAGFIPEYAPQVKINSMGSQLAHKKATNPHYCHQKRPLNNSSVVCGVESCTLLLTQGRLSLVIRLVFKNLCQNACNISVCTHSE